MSIEATIPPTFRRTFLPWRRQLRWTLAVYFVVLVAVPLVAMSVFFLNRANRNTRQQSFEKLEAVADLKEQEIARWLSDGNATLGVLMAGDTRRARFILLATSDEASLPAPQNAVNQIFADAIAGHTNFKEFFLYDAEGNVLASSSAAQIGKIVSRQPYFAASLQGTYVQPPYYELGSDQLTMLVTRPILDTSNRIIGAIAGRLDLNTLGQIMSTTTGLGDTGETYLVSTQSNYMLTPSRFEGFSLTQSYHTQGIDRALSGADGTGTYTDYRGKIVYGVYRWIPTMNAGLLAEQDQTEAQEPYTTARTEFIGFTLLAALVAVVAGVLVSTRLTGPLTALTQVASRIAGGDLSARSESMHHNEIGVLARTFNTTASQLEELVNSLEERVAARTRDLFLTLEVGQMATRSELQEELLPRVTNYIRDQFDLYYVQVYLLDDAKRYAVLAAGTGEVGQQLLARQHRLDMHQTAIVTRAAQTQRPVLVSNTELSDVHRPNPLLPDTRSEVAIPLIYGDQVLGVLDMQAREADTFREDNLPVFEAMASQLASALRSAQAYAETQTAVQHATELNRRLTSEAWVNYLGRVSAGELLGFEYDLQNVRPISAALPEPPAPSEDGHSQQIARPLVLGGQPIGSIVVTETGERTWSSDELDLIDSVAQRVAEAVEQYRAFDDTAAALSETENQARRLVDLNTMANEMGAAEDMNEVYRIVAVHANNILHSARASIALLLPTGHAFELFGLDGIQGAIPLGAHVPFEGSWLGEVVRGRRIRSLSNLRRMAQYAEVNQLVEQGLKSSLSAPLVAGDTVLGTLNVAATAESAYTTRDENLLGQIASLLVSHMETHRLLEQTRRRAVELETAAEVGTEAATSLDPDQLLWNVSNLTKERFDLYHAHIYLLDVEAQSLVLAAGAGTVGQRMVSAGHSIPFGSPRSLVARAARTREGVIANNVADAPDFLPNPLLPHTKAEMAIPMIAGESVLGVLDVQSERVNYFTQQDVAVLSLFASQVAVATENARLFADQVEAADRLRDVDRLKSEFLASMSHELRTPLNSIIGYAEVLLDGIDGDLTDDMNEDVGAIHGSGKHLLNLINDILDLAKIEAGQMDLVQEPIALRPVVEDAVNTVRVLVKAKPVELVIETEPDLPQINGDALRLRQIINNLLTNATKFTEKGAITVRAQVYDQDPSMVLVSVTDTGIGIAPEKLPVIFDRFRQVDQSHTRRAGGTGLGLSITRQLVQMHGGELWAESTPGAGSTFFFTLPIVVETADAEA